MSANMRRERVVAPELPLFALGSGLRGFRGADGHARSLAVLRDRNQGVDFSRCDRLFRMIWPGDYDSFY